MLVGLLVYRCLIIFVPSIRAKVLNARNRLIPREIAYAVSKKTDIGDWWIIYMLGRNLDPIIYKDVLAKIDGDGAASETVAEDGTKTLTY